MTGLLEILEQAPGLTFWGVALLAVFVLSLVVDTMLSRRYSAGDGSRDKFTSRYLVLSLSFNTILMVCSSYFGFGQLSSSFSTWMVPGFLIALMGALVRYSSILSLGNRFTWRVEILKEHALKEDGLYALVRHPSYLGGLLSVYGAALVYQSLVSLAVLTCTHLPLLIYRISVEEEVLANYFGESFTGYRGRTYRLVPYLF
jgi:protein-S-isoprenylcysteine O-methyltransferase